MSAAAVLSSAGAVRPLRVRYRQEMNGQIVHDSVHSRDGWTRTYACTVDGAAAGFGSVAIAGPWTDRPTLFEFYVLPEHRARAFELFEALLTASEAAFMEAQSSDLLLTAMLHTYAGDIQSESIVFRDAVDTALASHGAVLHRLTPEDVTRRDIARRAGQAECALRVGGETVATGALLFHYNVPYADIAMEVGEPFRRRGYGAYLVQELKRLAYTLEQVPGARCSPANIASRRTLQKAGLVPFAHILTGSVRAG